jgi:hypothetical protein
MIAVQDTLSAPFEETKQTHTHAPQGATADPQGDTMFGRNGP